VTQRFLLPLLIFVGSQGPVLKRIYVITRTKENIHGRRRDVNGKPVLRLPSAELSGPQPDYSAALLGEMTRCGRAFEAYNGRHVASSTRYRTVGSLSPAVSYPGGRALLCGHTERTFGVRSAAADCHFPPCELARGIFNREHDSQPASWLVTKRQQAAALQSFASRAGHGAR